MPININGNWNLNGAWNVNINAGTPVTFPAQILLVGGGGGGGSCTTPFPGSAGGGSLSTTSNRLSSGERSAWSFFQTHQHPTSAG